MCPLPASPPHLFVAPLTHLINITLATTAQYIHVDNVQFFPCGLAVTATISPPRPPVMASNSFQGRVWWARPKLDHKAFTLVSLEEPARMTATWGDSTRPYQPAFPRLDPLLPSHAALFSSHCSLFSSTAYFPLSSFTASHKCLV